VDKYLGVMFEGWTTEEMIGFLVVYGVLAALVSLFAQSRGRDGVGWFGVALFLSPPLTFILLVLMGPAKARA
jgi:hypothetical protein